MHSAMLAAPPAPKTPYQIMNTNSIFYFSNILLKKLKNAQGWSLELWETFKNILWATSTLICAENRFLKKIHKNVKSNPQTLIFVFAPLRCFATIFVCHDHFFKKSNIFLILTLHTTKTDQEVKCSTSQGVAGISTWFQN